MALYDSDALCQTALTANPHRTSSRGEGSP
jgi:hypothetical protein